MSHRTTLYKGVKRPDGKLVVLDVDYLTQTSKVVAHGSPEETLAKSLGWADSPQEAMARIERAEDQVAIDAAVSASDDAHLSEKAQAEVLAYESTTLEHLPEIPEAPKKRGRPRKPPQEG
jgi:hypothetical protein